MAAQLGSWTTMFLFLYGSSAAILWAFGEKKNTFSAIATATGIAWALLTMIFGYGLSESLTPDFLNAFLALLVPAALVLILRYAMLTRSSSKNNTESM
jgi:purine-cytosine permease-like protein